MCVFLIRGEARGNVVTHRITRSNCIYAVHAMSFIACLYWEIIVRFEIDMVSQATRKTNLMPRQKYSARNYFSCHRDDIRRELIGNFAQIFIYCWTPVSFVKY